MTDEAGADDDKPKIEEVDEEEEVKKEKKTKKIKEDNHEWEHHIKLDDRILIFWIMFWRLYIALPLFFFHLRIKFL